MKKNKKRKFKLYAIPEIDGIQDVSKSGWITRGKEGLELTFHFKDALIYEENDPGHGSFEDWKEALKEYYPDWYILKPRYLP